MLTRNLIPIDESFATILENIGVGGLQRLNHIQEELGSINVSTARFRLEEATIHPSSSEVIGLRQTDYERSVRC